MKLDILRIPAFRDLFIGQAISQIGDAMYYTSFMYMVKKVSGQDAMVGYVGALEVLPFLLFSAHAGLAADRLDRRKILVWTDILSALILFVLGALALFNGAPSIPSILIGVFMLSTVRVFFFPARNACVPRLVPESRLSDAFALSLGTQNIMMLGGTAFSAMVLGLLFNLSPLGFFVSVVGLNALSFLLSAYFVARIPPIIPERTAAPESAGKDIKDGLLFVKNRADLRMMMVVGMLFSLGVSPFFVAHVASNDAWFGGHPSTLAWSEFSFFLGMVIGTYWVGRRPVQRVGLAFVAALGVVAVGVFFMAFSRWYPAYAFWNIVCGVALPFADIPKRTYLQLSVPDGFRGRVNALDNMLNTSMMPLGMASAGNLLAAIGLVKLFLIQGLVMLAACVLGLFGREFRQSRMPVVAAES